mmetsp:Transcript_21986/g.87272  ORF Transcript_21986/g.87272 Transcript_21986/m.87272 type:complete len:431 (+) Transcript_21986:230-1522(+)
MIAGAANNLAMLLQAMGHFADARPLCERAVALAESRSGGLPLAALVANLGSVCEDLGDLDAARQHLERAVGLVDPQVKGPQGQQHHPHPEQLARWLTSLGGVARAQGRDDEARPLLERAVAVVEAARGPEHPAVAARLRTLAALLRAQRDSAAAVPVLERVVRISSAACRRRKDATKCEPLASDLGALGAALHARGAYPDAGPLFERALRLREEALGPDHAASMRSKASLAANARHANAPNVAVPLLRELVSSHERASTRPDACPARAAALIDLAEALLELLDHVETTQVEEHLLQGDAQTPTPAAATAPDVVTAEAVAAARRALAIRRRALGAAHEHTAVAHSVLGWCLLAATDVDAAFAAHEAAAAICERLAPANAIKLRVRVGVLVADARRRRARDAAAEASALAQRLRRPAHERRAARKALDDAAT